MEGQDPEYRPGYHTRQTVCREWQRQEEIPCYTRSYVPDLHTLELAYWARISQQGALWISGLGAG